MKIISRTVLAHTGDTRIVKLVVNSPLITAKAEPGQFVILMVAENGERIPLTIVESDRENQNLTLIFQEVGYSTKLLGEVAPGQSLYSLVGPLGKPTVIKDYGKVLAVGGGVGIAELLPIIKALKEQGCRIYSVLGAKTKELLILEEEIEKYSDRVFPCTDDGSRGRKGFVSDVLEDILREDAGFGVVHCVGPVPMMRVVSEITRPYKIKTIVCLNAIMLDGTGMCGGCRLIEDSKVKFCCVDGPDFDGHLVDFEDLMNRQKRFAAEEQVSLSKPRKHNCRCQGA